MYYVSYIIIIIIIVIITITIEGAWRRETRLQKRAEVSRVTGVPDARARMDTSLFVVFG